MDDGEVAIQCDHGVREVLEDAEVSRQKEEPVPVARGLNNRPRHLIVLDKPQD